MGYRWHNGRLLDDEEYYQALQADGEADKQLFQIYLSWLGIPLNFIIISLVLGVINNFKGGMDSIFWIGLPVTFIISWIMRKLIGKKMLARITGFALLGWGLAAVVGIIVLMSK